MNIFHYGNSFITEHQEGLKMDAIKYGTIGWWTNIKTGITNRDNG